MYEILTRLILTTSLYSRYCGFALQMRKLSHTGNNLPKLVKSKAMIQAHAVWLQTPVHRTAIY